MAKSKFIPIQEWTSTSLVPQEYHSKCLVPPVWEDVRPGVVQDCDVVGLRTETGPLEVFNSAGLVLDDNPDGRLEMSYNTQRLPLSPDYPINRKVC